jgi:hypothetical protein
MPWASRSTTKDGQVRYKAKYRDPAGRPQRSAGAFSSRAAAVAAAHEAASSIRHCAWVDPTGMKVTFEGYVEHAWWPSRHLEISTKAA